jgi:hypothetical protein
LERHLKNIGDKMTYRQEISPENVEKFRRAAYRTASEVDKTKLGYIGLIGTSTTRGQSVHDLDVLVFPSPNVGVGEAIIAMNDFYRALDARLQAEDGLYLATCPRKILQAEVNHIIGQVRGRKNKLSTHTLFFPDERSFNVINPVGFPESSSFQREDVVGDFDVIRRTREMPQKTLEPFFWIGDYNISLVADRYPGKLVLEKTEEVTAYLKTRYNLVTGTTLPRTSDDCAKLVDEVLLELDRRAA